MRRGCHICWLILVVLLLNNFLCLKDMGKGNEDLLHNEFENKAKYLRTNDPVGVNFTNVLRAAFMYVSCARSFFVPTF